MPELLKRIEQIKQSQVVKSVELLPEVKSTITSSNIDDNLELLKSHYPINIDRCVIEGGKKLVIDIRWPSEEASRKNRMVLSIRENHIAFMGSPINQYLLIEGDDTSKKELVSEYLAQTFTNPQVI